MSYIRCLSNPEGLYIWHDVGRFIAITGDNVEASDGSMMIKANVEDFNEILTKWNGQDSLNVRSLSLRLLRGKKSGYTPYSHYRLTIKHENGTRDKVDMWVVTWAYIARQAPQ